MKTSNDRLTLPLRRWRKGERLAHDKLNEPVDAISRIVGGIGLPRQIRRGLGGDGGDAPAVGSKIMRLYVLYVQWYPDHITCTTEAGGGDIYKVALPWMLRFTPFDGETRNGITYDYFGFHNTGRRTATNEDDATENQIIIPSYYPDDQIFAISPVNTGAYDETGPEPIYLTMLDMNVDARAWMREYEEM